MPLVTLTCKGKYFPPQHRAQHAELDAEAYVVIELAQALPEMMINNRTGLGLDDDTPEEAVQVDIKEFHTNAVNAVDIWIHVQFTEVLDAHQARIATDTLATALDLWLMTNTVKFSWALDVFFGPGHGCYTDSHGIIVKSW
jgi:hypothetical protein